MYCSRFSPRHQCLRLCTNGKQPSTFLHQVNTDGPCPPFFCFLACNSFLQTTPRQSMTAVPLLSRLTQRGGSSCQERGAIVCRAISHDRHFTLVLLFDAALSTALIGAMRTHRSSQPKRLAPLVLIAGGGGGFGVSFVSNMKERRRAHLHTCADIATMGRPPDLFSFMVRRQAARLCPEPCLFGRWLRESERGPPSHAGLAPALKNKSCSIGLEAPLSHMSITHIIYSAENDKTIGAGGLSAG